MRVGFVFVLLLIAMSSIALAQRSTTPERSRTLERSRQPASARDITRSRSAEAQRCANFGQELREATRAERDATTTTSSDQASLRRQQIELARQKAGC